MKRKTKLFLSLFLALDLLLLGAAGARLAVRAAERRQPFPMWVAVEETEEPGLLDGAKLEFMSLEAGEEEDILRVRLEPPPTMGYAQTTNFMVLYYSEARQGWYMVYSTNYPEIEYDYGDLDDRDDVKGKHVPHRLFARAGRYKIGFTDVGFCDVTVDGRGNLS